MEIKNEAIDQLIEDIQFIREAINRNTIYVKKVIYTSSVRITSFFAGLMMLLLSFLHYYFIVKFGSYETIPADLRIFLIAGIIFAFIGSLAIKSTALVSMKRMFPEATFSEIMVKLYGWTMIQYYFIIIGIIAFLSIYFSVHHLVQFIVPVCAIGIGLLFYILGVLFRLWELWSLGLWLIVPGTISIPFIGGNSLNALIWLAAIFGAGFIYFGVITQILASKK